MKSKAAIRPLFQKKSESSIISQHNWKVLVIIQKFLMGLKRKIRLRHHPEEEYANIHDMRMEKTDRKSIPTTSMIYSPRVHYFDQSHNDLVSYISRVSFLALRSS